MKETAISVNKHIYQLLTSDRELMRLTKKNVFPLVAEESVTYPFVIFTKEQAQGNYTKDLLCYDSATISVAVVASNYFETVLIAERVRTILENRRDAYFMNITFDSISEDFIEDAFVQELTINAKIIITEN